MPRFSKANRLLKSSEFSQVLAQGMKIVIPAAVVRVCRESEVSKLGLVVSRRVGNAVQRNRVKRRLREIFRHEMASFEVPWSVVIIVRQDAVRLDSSALRTNILNALARLQKRLLSEPTKS